ncbi:hypothetical protein AB4Y45_25465 [Paraburkholderia sp. EG287A]|uniref:hypothetical protein n=1 Tax=unclassified Paraburkholderia TaxID=2615204 RepID=UPI0034D22C80
MSTDPVSKQHHLVHALAWKQHLQHECERMRDALHHIEDIASTSADPKSLRTIAQVARSALAPSQPPNPKFGAQR